MSAIRKAISRSVFNRCCDCIGEREQEGEHCRKTQPGSTFDESGQCVIGAMESFENIRKKCLSTGQLYEDQTFPANASTLYRDSPIGQVVWKRPKELETRPYFFYDDAAYFDMDQGSLGDCWLVASAVCLAASPHRKLLFRVVPKDQGFGDDYCGAFHFNFWRYGKWVEVVIDDRLPTVKGRLIYASNRAQPNEFWCPLLEKAYAKLYGSYNAIHGGFMDESLVDLTAGIGEAISLFFIDQKKVEQMISNAHKMNSVIGATIDLKTPKPGMREVRKDNGLFQGHAYSIINVKEVKHRRKKVTLMHLRNPWGRGEWKGPWSDKSKEWKSLGEEDKHATLRTRDDGEFWISLEDFLDNFDFLCMAHLTPDAHSEEIADNLHLTQWNIAEHSGSWVRGASSGGPLKSFSSPKFWTNPQFKLRLSKASNATTVIISLFEVNTPAVRSLGEVSIGFVAFQMNEGHQPTRINAENYYEFTPRLVATSKGFTIHREVTRRFDMDPLDHVIVPCTQKEGQQAEFYMRIFSDTKIDAELLGGEDVIDTSTTSMETDANAAEGSTTSKLEQEFDHLAGESKRIDANDFKSILKYSDDESDAKLNLETCRCLLSAATVKSRKGLATKEEMKDILKVLGNVKMVFGLIDRNSSKSVDRDELETLLHILERHPVEEEYLDADKWVPLKEYGPTYKVVDAVWKRYGGKHSRLSYEDFIQTCCKFVVLSRSYEELDYVAKSYIKWQEWVQTGFI